MKEIRKCWKCDKEFNSLEWDPHYDSYGLMGTGYTQHSYCKECRKSKVEAHAGD